jgi:hypothetical protein
MKMTSHLLLNEPPIQVIPSLATAVGLNEAIILQQLHYWLIKNEHVIDGVSWDYNSYEEWHAQFPWWSAVTIRRTITSLERRGYLRSGNFNRKKSDQTKWYTIVYEQLAKTPKPGDQFDHLGRARRSPGASNLSTSLKDPETTAETPTETSYKRARTRAHKRQKPIEKNQESASDTRAHAAGGRAATGYYLASTGSEDALTTLVLARYYDVYARTRKKVHPPLKVEQLARIYAVLAEAWQHYQITETVDALSFVDQYWKRLPRSDGNINHFATAGVLDHLALELGADVDVTMAPITS